jgi:3-deoxy-D-manno-octulosonate 8-phosphate phosphatase (KDO 8-P phosphatase)
MLKHEHFGGQFITMPDAFKLKLANLKAIVADWDGVFNNGCKSADMGSGFSEPDSLGLNMFRFAYWLETQTILPIAIITGEPNESAKMLAVREKFNGLYFGTKDKKSALNHFTEANQLHLANTAIFFDDIIDVSMLKDTGLRFMVNRPGPKAFEEYIVKNHLADYITSTFGGQNAVREIAELLLVMNGSLDKVIEERTRFSDAFKTYMDARDGVKLNTYKWDKDHFANY